MVRVAINGYGRIGRVAHRVILERFQDQVEVVAINASSSTDNRGWAYLLKYDTAYGTLDKTDISSDDKNIIVNGKPIPVFNQKDPSQLPWKSLNVDVVIESTGHFTTEDKMRIHLNSGARSVVLSAPVKEGSVPTYVLSVNDKEYKGNPLISNASCTTNCITPVAKIMVDHFGVEKAMMTTIHAFTSDQRLQDGGHQDYRRARAAAHNIVPTTSGATIAASQALPELAGIFEGLAIRVPVISGSLSDFTFLLKKDTTKEEVNDVFKKEADNPIYKGIIKVTEDPLVSSDVVGSPFSAIIDASLTQVVGGNMVKVIAWYDNEYGYANRLIEEVVMVGSKLSS